MTMRLEKISLMSLNRNCLRQIVFFILLFCSGILNSQTTKLHAVYGGDANFPPYEYLNESGIPEGFNIDIIKAISKEMNFEVIFKLGNWSEIREEFEATDNIDISDMFYSKERDDLVDFSIPFTIAYDEIFVRKNTEGINSIDDISGKKVIVQNLSFIYDKLRSNYPLADLILVESEPEALLLLSKGVGDCAILSQTVTRNIFQVKNYSDIIRVGYPIFPKEYAFVVKNGNSELLRIINNGLVKLKDKKILDEIEDKWFGQKEEEYETVKTFLIYLVSILISLSLILAGIIVWNRALKRQVLLKTQNLMDTHKKLTDTLENMDEGFFWINNNWIITNVNRQATRLLNKSPEDILNKHIWTEFPRVKEQLYSEYNKAIETRNPVNIEFYFKPENKWYENRIVPAENGIAVFVKDITEKKSAEELIKESESNLNSVIENSTEAIWAIDKNYSFIVFNNFFKQRFFEIYGRTLNKGMSALEFLQAEQFEFWKEKYDTALSGKRLTFELSIIQNKTRKFYDIFLNPIIIDNVVKGVSVFRIDITESKLRELQLIEAKNKAEKSDKLKTEFLAQISHEIRTPINNILNYTGLLLESCSNNNDEESKLISDSIESSSKRIMRTIDLILNMSEIQLGSYNTIIKRVDLINEIIKPIINDNTNSALKKNLSLQFSTVHSKLYVNGDLYSLTQIISNLVDNAVKFTNSGNVTVSALYNDEEEILVSIADTGIGISEEFLPNLFEPFRQEEQGYTRSYEGNGIGLALVKKYCEINNVIIDVQSSKTEGTKFSLIFEKPE